MTSGEKMLWASTVAAWVKSWHDQGQPGSFKSMMTLAVTEATAVVEAVREMSMAPLDGTTRNMVRDVITEIDED